MNVWGQALMPRIGFACRAFQSYARASYAELIPPGEEARWYVSLDPLLFCARPIGLQVRTVLHHRQGAFAFVSSSEPL